ncbi:MAG: GGDEF domain-containing protein [Candidatus Pacebacteria bacterium]|nr:GGDEF domain-containing protein [Candidatus Paceibacterota bacterium]
MENKNKEIKEDFVLEKYNFLKLENEIKSLKKIILDKDEKIKELSSLYQRDFLTLLYNRHGFMAEVDKIIDEGRKLKNKQDKRKIILEAFSLIFIDVDDLKKINDKCGHSKGDEVLKMMAEVFKSSVRKFDIVARWGGDEFIIGLVGVNSEKAVEIAENIKKKIQLLEVGGKKLSVSFGITDVIDNCIENKEDIIALVEKADEAMYRAKSRLGKNTIVVYNCKTGLYE